MTICSTNTAAPLATVVPLIPLIKVSCDIFIADPDSVTLAGHALDVRADIDIITIAFEKVVSRILTQCRV